MQSNAPPPQSVQLLSNNIVNATQVFPVQVASANQRMQSASIINNFQPLVGSPTSAVLNQPSQNFLLLRQNFW